jgi:hypothetical protein
MWGFEPPTFYGNASDQNDVSLNDSKWNFFVWDLQAEEVLKAQDLLFLLGTWCGTPIFAGTTPKVFFGFKNGE